MRRICESQNTDSSDSEQTYNYPETRFCPRERFDTDNSDQENRDESGEKEFSEIDTLIKTIFCEVESKLMDIHDKFSCDKAEIKINNMIREM